MNSTFRLIKGELDKIFVRPAIFVMTAFFVLAMVLSALTFSPAPRQDNRITYDEATSVSQVRTSFYSETDSYRFKYVFDNKLENNASKILGFYTNPTSDFIKKDDLISQTNTISTVYSTYRANVLNHDSAQATTNLEINRNSLVSEISKLKIMINEINGDYPTLLVKTTTYNDLIDTVSYLSSAVSVNGDVNSLDYHKNIVGRVQENHWIANISSLINKKFRDIKISHQTINNLNKILNEAKTVKLPSITSDLEKFYAKALESGEAFNTSTKNINKAINIVSNYKLVVDEVIDIIYCSILVDVCEKLQSKDVPTYFGEPFKTYDNYKFKEQISRSSYLFENDAYDYQYANVFQAGFASNDEADAYDFMYYSMELLSILIVLFCVILGADMIAGEQANGTLKLLAIRPYKRSKILNAKISSTIIFGMIFIIIGMIASFIIGAFAYGVDNSPVLATFNATDSFSIHPMMLMFIYLLTLLLRIVFYTIIAVFLSTLFKSNIASISISFVLYLLVALFAPVLKNTFIYKYLPFVNADLFKYFGGEFQNSGTNSNIFGLDFTPPIIGDMNFVYSIINIIVFSSIILIFNHLVFKKRDIS